MKRNSSIVSKLIIYFLLLNIFTVIVVGSYSYYRAKDALVERTFDQLTSLRIEKKFRIEQFFNNRLLDINLVSKSENIVNIINLLTEENLDLGENNNQIFSEYDKFLNKHLLSYQYYKRFFVAKPNGLTVSLNISGEFESQNIYTTVKDLPIFNLWEKINKSNEISIEDYKLDKNTNLPAIFIGAPVVNKSGKKLGVIVIEIDIDAINSIMYENNPHNGLGKSGESYLVGADYLMRSNSRFEDNSVFKTMVNSTSVQKALKGETGTSIINDYRDISVLSSFGNVAIPGLDWAIISEIDEKEAMIPIDSIRNNILYLSILISLLLFAFVYVIANRISLPIVKLKQAAQTITEGNYNVFVEDIESNDEIASLIEAFNEMSLKIKEQTENLKLEKSMRLTSMIDGQELERQRLSRELHDGLGQSILAIKMRLERTSNASPEKITKIMAEVQILFANIINEIRSISNNLIPAVLNEFGLLDALNNLCSDVTKNSGIKIEFKNQGFTVKIEDKINTYLYRISQEALNNIIKHSEASLAIIELNSDKDFAYLNISDNGKGFNYIENRKMCGNGISNMKERVLLLNGNIEITSLKDEGTTLKIRVPI